MDIFKISLFTSVFIIVIIMVRASMLNRLPKKTFLLLWIITAFRLLVPFSASSRFSIYTFLNTLKSLLAPKTGMVAEMHTISYSPIAIPFIKARGSEITSLSAFSLSSIATIITIIWGIGTCILALYFFRTYIRCVKEYRMSLPVKSDFVNQWLTRHSLKRKLNVRISERIKAPLTYGILHPIILLPKEIDWMNEDQLCYVLTHEFTHIRHFDTLTKLILTLCVCVHWFNPLVWVMYLLANRDIELCCDETVVLTFSQDVKSSYAFTLIHLAETRTFTPFVNNFSKNSLEERIVSIMKTKKASHVKILLSILLIIGLPILFTTNSLTAKGSIASEANTTYDVSSNTPDHLPKTIEELSSEYGKFGIWFDLKGTMYFHDTIVRYFYDGVDLDKYTSTVRYEYLNEKGSIDMHTTRTIIDNKDGSIDPFGELTNITAYSQEEFNQRDLSLLNTTPEAVTTEIGTDTEGETFVQKFAKYKDYGVTYQEKKGSGIRNIYYNGQLVKHFVDINKQGEVFSMGSTDGGEIIVQTVYDEKGNLLGLDVK